ncbi:hypothetical protein BC827DRAFT_1216356 [Russula dissimulans]|nr:hypothetical protein BC827DRAFT_1216356 [Russula dissimulans]
MSSPVLRPMVSFLSVVPLLEFRGTLMQTMGSSRHPRPVVCLYCSHFPFLAAGLSFLISEMRSIMLPMMPMTAHTHSVISQSRGKNGPL